MTEPKITRDRIEKFLHEARNSTDDCLVKFYPDELEALCILALQAEAMQPRPMSELPNDGKQHAVLRRYKGSKEWADTVKYEYFNEHSEGHFIPLNALPEPNP